MDVTIIKTKGALSKSIANIASSISKLDEQIHRAAVSALWFYKEDGGGNLDFLTALAKATAKYSVNKKDEESAKAQWDGRSVRGADLRRWIEDFAGVKWSVAANKGEGGWRASKSIKAVKRGDIDLEKAAANPFYEYSKDSNEPPKLWDAVKYATNLRDQAIKMLEEGESKSGKQVLPEDAKEQRAVASSLVNSLSEFLKYNSEHANPDLKGQTIEGSATMVEEVQETEADNIKGLTAKAS